MWWEHWQPDSSSNYEADNRILSPLTKIKGEPFWAKYSIAEEELLYSAELFLGTYPTTDSQNISNSWVVAVWFLYFNIASLFSPEIILYLQHEHVFSNDIFW